jgi:hypothetical protein
MALTLQEASPLCSIISFLSRLLKNGHLRRFLHPSSLRRTAKYASFLWISGALHLTIFEQPEKDDFFSSLLGGLTWQRR